MAEKLYKTTYNVFVNRLSYCEALNFIKLGEHDYDRPLSEIIDIELCAKKWSKYAYFLFVLDKKDLVSLLVFYNNKKSRMLYLTHFVVSSRFRCQGIGTKVFQYLHKYAESINCKTLQLEVFRETPAYRLYNKLGYVVVEDRGDKLLMEYKI